MTKHEKAAIDQLTYSHTSDQAGITFNVSIGM
jgi:hypothetical protein